MRQTPSTPIVTTPTSAASALLALAVVALAGCVEDKDGLLDGTPASTLPEDTGLPAPSLGHTDDTGHSGAR